MSFPCINTAQLDPAGGLHPKPIYQWRHLATASAVSVDVTLTFGGAAHNDLIHTVQALWSNTTGITYQVYALVTRGGSVMFVTQRSRGYLNQLHGTAVGVAPADPATVLVSRMGVGGDTGLNSGQADYGIIEERAGDRTAFLGVTTAVPTGQQFKARCELRFVTDFWETTTPINGDGTPGEIENGYLSGATRVDLYGYPVIP